MINYDNFDLEMNQDPSIPEPEHDLDDFYDSYEVEPHGWAVAGAGAAFVVAMLCLAVWMAFH